MKIVRFHATWCAPCKKLAPKLTEIAERLSIPIESIDIDENMSKAQEFGVMSVPTIIFVEDDKEVGRFVGDAPAAVVETMVKTALNSIGN